MGEVAEEVFSLIQLLRDEEEAVLLFGGESEQAYSGACARIYIYVYITVVAHSFRVRFVFVKPQVLAHQNPKFYKSPYFVESAKTSKEKRRIVVAQWFHSFRLRFVLLRCHS